MSATDLCRLCLTKDNLVWIFDKRFNSSENMKDVIYITTGVEILKTDIISQKICRKCCQVTIKMFEFRRTSLKNDKYLKEECKKQLKERSIKIPNTQVIIKSDIKCKSDEVKVESKPDVSKPVFKLHPSVRNLFRVYPRIKLPTVCLNSHITPCVSMQMDDVENYFKRRNLDFNQHTKLALKSGRKVATKKTSLAAKPKTVNSSNSSKSYTAEIIASTSENKDNAVGPIKNKVSSNNIVISDKVKDTTITSHSKNKDIAKDNATIPHSKNKDVASKKDGKKRYIDLTKPKVNSKEATLDHTVLNRKRKYSEIEDSSKTLSHKMPHFIESLGLTPKSNDAVSTSATESPSLSYVATTSVPLHICTMCNSVQYSAKDLRRHQNKHLRCQFCKTKFRTLETKTKHIANTCIIKNTMNNLPDVPLTRIEYSAKMREKYPEAFVNFPPLKNSPVVKDNTCTIKNTEEVTPKDTNRVDAVDEIKQETIYKPLDGRDSVDIGEIIEILSDDEDIHSKNAGVDKLTTGTVTTQTLNDAKATAQSTSVNSAICTSNNLALTTDNVVYNTVSIVKPDIRIKNNNLLENIESSTESKLTDIKILKELIKAKPLLQLTMARMTQTEMPSNESITINRSDFTGELKHLKQQLYVYKIPVVIKNGQFNVTYNSHHIDEPPKKLCLWNDLKPIDIKTLDLTSPAPAVTEQTMSKNEQTSGVSTVPAVPTDNLTEVERPQNETSVLSATSNIQGSDNTVILPSTATYNSSGFESVRPQTTTNTSKPVSVNTTIVNSNNLTLDVPTTSIIESNPMLNSFLESQSASTCSTETTTTQYTSPSSNVETPIIYTPTPIPLGLIRVKDVWELS